MENEPSPQATVTLRRIAEEAGVSKMAVSLALRNTPGVSSGTRARIRAIAERLGYHPDAEVSRYFSHVRSGNSYRELEPIALLTAGERPDPWESDPYQKRFFRNASAFAARVGHRLEPFWISDPGFSPARLGRVLRARGIRGLILGMGASDPGQLPDLTKFASVAYADSWILPQLHRVGPDGFHNVLLALRNLSQLGYHRIGLAIAEPERRADSRSEGAYAFHHSQLGESMPAPVLSTPSFRDTLLPWVEEHHFDAILTNHPGAVRLLREAHIRVPQDIGAGLLGVIQELPQAGIDTRSHLIDAAALDLLTGQLRRHEIGLPESPQKLLIEGCWLNGATVRKQKRPDSHRPAPRSGRG